MNEPLRNPENLAIIIGVSECPSAPQLDRLPQCAASAAEFRRYLAEDVGLSADQILYLFDSDVSSSDQLSMIEDWLENLSREGSKTYKNLIIYYTGHGGFTRNDQSYFLATRKTRNGSEGHTSIRYIDLSNTLRKNSKGLRKLVILDCCFAASAVIKHQSALEQSVKRGLGDAITDSGTAVLCSSAATKVSIAPVNERFTMFSGALFACLEKGIAGGRPNISLGELAATTRALIVDKYAVDAVRPELHVPEQAWGNPADAPIFPNRAWVEPMARNFERDLLDLHLQTASTIFSPLLFLPPIVAYAGMYFDVGSSIVVWAFVTETMLIITIFLNKHIRTIVNNENYKALRNWLLLGQIPIGIAWGWIAISTCEQCSHQYFFFFKGATLIVAISVNAFSHFMLKNSAIYTFAPVSTALLFLYIVSGNGLDIALFGVFTVTLMFFHFITLRLYGSNRRLLDYQSQKDDLIADLEQALTDAERKIAELSR